MPNLAIRRVISLTAACLIFSASAIAEDGTVSSASSVPALVKVEPEQASWYGNGVAVSGHDVVAYFSEDLPVDGDPALSVMWQNAEWRFSSQDNLEAFKADPEKFAPQFGGYCPVALSKGDLKIGTSDQFAVIGEQLFLNFDGDTNFEFRNNESTIAAKAKVNWREIF
ncbi:MAG: YHS domain-containing (seleno)protein [Pseudomonadota bacterium]